MANNFKDTVKINVKDMIDIEKIIHELETDLKKYKGTSEDKTAVDIFRSGRMITFDTLLSAGLLFKIYETCGRSIDAHILTRVKSQASIEEKQHRKGREQGKSLGDIIGSSLIADRVHNYTEIISIFNSPEIQISYNERQSNIRLLKEVSEFILNLNSEENNIASDLDDNYSKNNHELVSRLNTNKKDCKVIIKNCNTYFQESNTPKRQKIPINRTLKGMCKYLMSEEIQRAFDKVDESLKREIKNKKHIEDELKELTQYGEDEETKIKMLQTLLSIQNQKIEMIKQQIRLIEQNTENRDIGQLKILLSNSLNANRIELLEEIDKHISKQIDNGEKSSNNSEEKLYCEYLAIVLYQIKRLEFVNEEDRFKGKTYETIEHSLYTQLEEYRDSEIEGTPYKNITFNDVQKLTTNLRRLNSRLSDKLQHNILDYSLQFYLNDVIRQFTGENPSAPDFKIKKNGYVATHIDIDMIKKIVDNQLIRLRKEFKLVTHHRDLESTTGTAAYGSGRQENMEAKTRRVELLENEMTHKIRFSKGTNKLKKANFHGNTREQLQEARSVNYLTNLLANTKISESSFGKFIKEKEEWKNDGRREKWEQELFDVIPKYSIIEYNAEEDAVNITFLSDYENVKKYYTETNLPIKRKKILEMLEKLKDNRMISDKHTRIGLTHEQYRYFMRNNLEDLRNSIVNLYLNVVNQNKDSELSSQEEYEQ
ncbi:MAG: hypothetical protein HFJ48_01675 [Clostridia bacterium]|nr:hypothetical protein [Clostridia bacterium]